MNKNIALFMLFFCYNCITTAEASETDMAAESETATPFAVCESTEYEYSSSNKKLDFNKTSESESESMNSVAIESETVLQELATELEDNNIFDPFNESEMDAIWNSLFKEDSFNVVTYRNKYSDLNAAFGNNWSLYYKNYIQYGYFEGRTGY